MKGRWAFPFFGAGFLLALTVTPAAAVPVLKMHVAGESTELASATNGAVITPTVGPQGTLVVRGSGSVTFAPVQTGNGVYFLQAGQQNWNTAFYQFTGAGLGNIFNVDAGEIEFRIKSRYDYATRGGDQNGRRVWFETYGGTANLFYVLMQKDAGSQLFLAFNCGGTTGNYFWFPASLFNLNQILKVNIVWNGTQRTVFLNDVQTFQENYTKATPNWTAGSAFSLGASNPNDGFTGGYFANDEPIDDFKVFSNDLVPPVVSNPMPTGTLHYSTTQTTISVNTDENATCKYGTSSAAYASLPNTFSTTGGTTHSHLITGLTSGVTRTYYVRCQDTSMNVNTSDTVINFSVGVVDTEDPSTPTGLVATASSYEAINLNWNASTDNIGVTGYRIYRGGSPLIVVPGTSFQDTGLTPSTLYTYRVTALDAGDNESGQSNQASATTQQAPPLVEWTLDGGPTYVVPSGNQLGTTGVTAEIRSAATVHGTRYDVRLRNRTGTDYTHSALRVRLPRSGSATTAQIEELGSVALPAEIRQFWAPPTGALTGAQYVFTYEIWGNGVLLKKVGPAAYQSGQTNNQWGGRTNGIVRIDGKVYIIREFWERQPRKITVTATEVILTLFEGSEPLRGGEDVWDRFAVLNTYAGIAPMRASSTRIPRAPATGPSS